MTLATLLCLTVVTLQGVALADTDNPTAHRYHGTAADIAHLIDASQDGTVFVRHALRPDDAVSLGQILDTPIPVVPATTVSGRTTLDGFRWKIIPVVVPYIAWPDAKDVPEAFHSDTGAYFCHQLTRVATRARPGAVVLLISVGDRYVRAYQSIATEDDTPALPDYALHRVVELIRPALAERQYSTAVVQGVMYIRDAMLGRELPIPGTAYGSASAMLMFSLFKVALGAGTALLALELYRRRKAHASALCAVLCLCVALYLEVLEGAVSLILLVTASVILRALKERRHQSFLHALSVLRRLKFDCYPNCAVVSGCALCLAQFPATGTAVRYPCEHFVHSQCANVWQKTLQRCVCPVCELPVANSVTAHPFTSPPSNRISFHNALCTLDSVRAFYSDESAAYDIEAVLSGEHLDVSWVPRLCAT